MTLSASDLADGKLRPAADRPSHAKAEGSRAPNQTAKAHVMRTANETPAAQSISGVSSGPNRAPAFAAEVQSPGLLAGPVAASARPLRVALRFEAQLGGDADSGKAGSAAASLGLDETLEMDDERSSRRRGRSARSRRAPSFRSSIPASLPFRNAGSRHLNLWRCPASLAGASGWRRIGVCSPRLIVSR